MSTSRRRPFSLGGIQNQSNLALRLLCVPYAGGNARVYAEWSRCLPAAIQIVACQLPGRGPRIAEAAAHDVGTVVEELVRDLTPYLDTPLAVFGHSYGALIAFELTRAVERIGVTPYRLYASASRAPHILASTRARHLLSDAELIDELRRIGGTPAAILDSAEMMQLLLPTIRADLQADETYSYVAGPTLQCPITALAGDCDANVSADDLVAWGRHTRAGFTVRRYNGGHFFLHTNQTELLSELRRDLVATVEQDAAVSSHADRRRSYPGSANG
jgi:medium-chain acyl-[acyl-carrier-protein] hydrolase